MMKSHLAGLITQVVFSFHLEPEVLISPRFDDFNGKTFLLTGGAKPPLVVRAPAYLQSLALNDGDDTIF